MIVTENSRMINLLDPAAKRDLRAARINIVLATYCVIVGFGLVCVLLLFLFSNGWLDKRIAAATSERNSNIAQAQTPENKATQQQAQSFSNNLNKIQSILSNRSHYSTALLNIAAALPEGASIGQVSLSSTLVATPLQISATTSNNQTALALKSQLTKSPIFSKVSLDAVNCTGPNGTDCAASLTATLSPAVFTQEPVQ